MLNQSTPLAGPAIAAAAASWLFAAALGGCASNASHIIVVPAGPAAEVSPGTLGEIPSSPGPAGRMLVVLGAGDELGWRLHRAGE